jgi:hypothetical protein
MLAPTTNTLVPLTAPLLARPDLGPDYTVVCDPGRRVTGGSGTPV